MTLQEAIESGRPFRRKGWNKDRKIKCDFLKSSDNILIWPSGGGYIPSVRDILAYDWELEEKTVEITMSMLREAYMRIAKGNGCYWDMACTYELAKELGLD